ncbi:MAG: hypothetical protein CL946_09060, partial [Ectothiorhodospiraceae bacterium]|nr:hypothetical protein [Ectothiorhodospiraceae bacterium]
PVRAATAPSSNVKAGHVLYQNPAGGSIVREGRNVYLTVSGGEQQVLMPSLRGRSLRDAKITLERLELAVGMITYEASDLPNETIVSQGISSGKKLSPGTPIDLVVSLGKDMQQIDVPYIVGFTLNDAQRKLLESGLKLGNVGYQENPSLSPHTVISQSPSAGEKVDPNAPIDVILVR